MNQCAVANNSSRALSSDREYDLVTTPGDLAAAMQALLFLSAAALAGAAASPQSIFFVNNSIEIPAFDSFIQMDAFASTPLKVLDSKVRHMPLQIFVNVTIS